MNELTLRERVKELELERAVQDSKLDAIKIQLDLTNKIIAQMSERLNEMYPIVKDVTMVREYGTFTWRLLKWIGGVTFSLFVSWHLFKEHIKHFFNYIFQ